MIRIFTSERQRTGELGELLAIKYLSEHGYVTRETNYSCRFGEIDIIAVSRGTIHFIEVKSVSRESKDQSKNNYLPEFNVSREKLKKLSRTIEVYISRNVSRETNFQVDIICVSIYRDLNKAYIKLFENIILD